MTIPAHIRLGETGADVASDKKGKGIVKAAYKLKSVILIKGEIRNTAGSNMGVEDNGDSIIRRKKEEGRRKKEEGKCYQNPGHGSAVSLQLMGVGTQQYRVLYIIPVAPG